MGVWRKPPCFFCKLPIQATSDDTRCPMFIPQAVAWSCRPCWEWRARGRTQREAEVSLHTVQPL